MPWTSEIGSATSGAVQAAASGRADTAASKPGRCITRRISASAGDAASVIEKTRESPAKTPSFR